MPDKLEEWFKSLSTLKDPIERIGRVRKVLRMSREPGHDFVSLKLNSGLRYEERKIIEDILNLLHDGDTLPNGLKVIKVSK